MGQVLIPVQRARRTAADSPGHGEVSRFFKRAKHRAHGTI